MGFTSNTPLQTCLRDEIIVLRIYAHVRLHSIARTSTHLPLRAPDTPAITFDYILIYASLSTTLLSLSTTLVTFDHTLSLSTNTSLSTRHFRLYHLFTVSLSTPVTFDHLSLSTILCHFRLYFVTFDSSLSTISLVTFDHTMSLSTISLVTFDYTLSLSTIRCHFRLYTLKKNN